MVEYTNDCAVCICVAKFTGFARSGFWDVTPLAMMAWARRANCREAIRIRSPLTDEHLMPL